MRDVELEGFSAISRTKMLTFLTVYDLSTVPCFSWYEKNSFKLVSGAENEVE